MAIIMVVLGCSNVTPVQPTVQPTISLPPTLSPEEQVSRSLAVCVYNNPAFADLIPTGIDTMPKLRMAYEAAIDTGAISMDAMRESLIECALAGQ